MLATGINYGVRGLWTGAGLCTVAVGALGDSAWEGRLLVILSGILTLLLSILLGGFVKHLAEHQEYGQSLEQRINEKAERLFEVLEKQNMKLETAQTKHECEIVQKFNAQQLQDLGRKLDALLQRERTEP